MKKYIILETCNDKKFDSEHIGFKENIYADVCPTFFDTREAALKADSVWAKQEAENLNESSETNAFRWTDDDSKYDAVVRFWDGDDYELVTGYNVREVIEEEAFWTERQFPQPFSDGSEKGYVCSSCNTTWDNPLKHCPNCGKAMKEEIKYV